jgi:thiamine-monophosphate kinase
MNEDRFIQRLLKQLPHMPEGVHTGPGDDCAALEWTDDQLLLVTVDQVVGDRHYIATGQNNPTHPERIGRKLLARNLSDIAAMGGQPLFAVVTLAFPKHKPPARFEAISQGIANLAKSYGVAVIGGDIATTPVDEVFTLTMLGQVAKNEIRLRSTAHSEDIVFMTGQAGASFESGHHLDFAPRLEQGRWLAQNKLATAMIDISDGVALDAFRMAKASKLRITLNLDAIPLRDPSRPPNRAIADGEDYELLFTVKRANLQPLLDRWPFDDVPIAEIGKCTPGKPDILDQSGNSLIDNTQPGFDHLA